MSTVGAISVPKDWWGIATDVCFCRNVIEHPYPVNVDKVSEESYKEVREILSTAMKVFHISKAVIHTVIIRMVQVLFSTTDNQAHKLPIISLSALC